MKEMVIEVMKTIFDPEIPVSLWELGLIYDIEFKSESEVVVTMTLTAPGCPVADQLLQEVHDKVMMLPRIEKVVVDLTFVPEWSTDRMSEEAKLELGFL